MLELYGVSANQGSLECVGNSGKPGIGSLERLEKFGVGLVSVKGSDYAVSVKDVAALAGIFFSRAFCFAFCACETFSLILLLRTVLVCGHCFPYIKGQDVPHVLI